MSHARMAADLAMAENVNPLVNMHRELKQEFQNKPGLPFFYIRMREKKAL